MVNQYAAGSAIAKVYAPFFPKGTTIASSSGANVVAQPDWMFHYLATSENCSSGQVQETWTDSYNVPEAQGGDITGVCATASS